MASNLLGLGNALSRIRRLPAAVREAREEVLEDWSQSTERDAKTRAPERTGRLQGSIDRRVYYDAAYVGTWDPGALEYAEYVEKGTSSMREQPYLVPAFEANRADVPRKLRRAIRRRLGSG